MKVVKLKIAKQGIKVEWECPSCKRINVDHISIYSQIKTLSCYGCGEHFEWEINIEDIRGETKTSKYLEFSLIEKKPKTKVIGVWSKNSSDRLGIIKWFGRWRQYAFFPEDGTVFNRECLNDIQSHMEELKIKNERHLGRKEKKGRTQSNAKRNE